MADMNYLGLEFHFKDIRSFYAWFNDPKTKEILQEIKKYAPNYMFELSFRKSE